MKKIKSIILVLTMMFTVSCMDMYNEVADDVSVEYNYFLAVADQSSIFRTYQINENRSIILSSVKSISLTAPRFPSASPSGEYVYIANGTTHTVSTYNVADDGSLLLVGTPVDTEGTTTIAVKVHPTGKYVYATNQGSGTVSMFTVLNDGSLQKIAAPLSTGGSSFPGRMAFHPSGKYLYIALSSGGGFAVCSVGSNGALTLVNTFSVGDNTIELVVHPSGRYIFVSTVTQGIYKYNIKSDGTIDSSGSANVTGANFNSDHLAIHPDGTYLFTAKGQYVYVFSINSSNGVHSYIEQTDYIGLVGAGGQINDISIHPSGKTLYVSEYGNSHLFMVNIKIDGTVAFDANYDTGMSFNGLALIRKKK